MIINRESKLNNKLIFLTILFTLLLGISAVSAAENSTSDIVSVDTDDDLTLEETTEDIPEPTELTFTDLNNTINNNTKKEINLYNNYKYNPDTDSAFKKGIGIFHKVTINGNGITIDGSHQARIFQVFQYTTFKNINFINGNVTCNYHIQGLPSYDIGEGGAIFGSARAENCNFTGNIADNGGAIEGVTAVDCNFINNTARTYGGAIYASFGGAAGCNFLNNRAGLEGGAIFNNKYAINCNFTLNHAIRGGAASMGELINCNL